MREVGIEYCLTRPARQSQIYESLACVMAGSLPRPVEQPVNVAVLNFQAHVLLAEDNFVNQELALNMLELLGCRGTIANNGLEVLETLGRTDFDLILMDCQMPEMDGFEATVAIRRREAAQLRTQRIPIVALTAGAIEGDREKCLAAGMDDYVTKPFSMADLTKVLERWLKRKPSSSSIALGKQSTVNGSKGAQHVDLATHDAIRALQQPGKDDLLGKLVGVYLRETPSRLQSMREAAVRNDAEAVGKLAHRLKSPSANLGATRLAKLCQQLEELARGNPMQGADSLVVEIETEFASVATELAGLAGGAV